MKKSFTLMVSFMVAVLVSISCSSPLRKVERAQNNVTEANKELDKANKEYLEDIKKYKSETAARIALNKQLIADLKARKKEEKDVDKDDFNKRIALLEQRNSDLKKTLDEYHGDGEDKWQVFKTKFNQDMNDLGNAFKDMGANKNN
jgi:uncharacterized protein YukE